MRLGVSGICPRLLEQLSSRQEQSRFEARRLDHRVLCVYICMCAHEFVCLHAGMHARACVCCFADVLQVLSLQF